MDAQKGALIMSITALGKYRVAAMAASASHREQRILSMVVLACVLVLTGCVKVGPDFIRPETQIRQQWMETDGFAAQTSPADYRTWWNVFRDPVLDTLVQIAYAQNIPLRVAGARVFEARARLGIAIGDQYPQVQQIGGSVSNIRESEQAPSAPQKTVSSDKYQYDQVQATMAAGWEIDFWGKFRSAVESDNAEFLGSIAAYDNALVSLTADVARAYIVIRTLEERLRIAQKNVGLQKESLRIAQTRFDAGAASGLDVDLAMTLLRTTEADIPPLVASLRQAKNALCILLGMPPGNLDHLMGKGSTIPQAPLEVAVGIPADLLRRRPDIRQAELQAAAQCALIGVAKSDLYPAFSLNGAFGFLSSDVGSFSLSDVTNWSSRYYSVGPSFTWNIFNYGQITNNVRVQDARFQELIFGYQNTVLRAQQEVEDALSGFQQAQKGLIRLVEAVEASQKTADLVMIQYQSGATNYTTVITAQQFLLANQTNLAFAQGNLPQALIAIYRALGGGWELRSGNLFLPAAITTSMGKRTNWGGLLEPAAVQPLDNRQLLTPDW
jgi:NodT family efflux transporter outer membrane factor (OMF) lipoprotein